MLRSLTVLFSVAVSACNNGSDLGLLVTGLQAQSLRYGQTAYMRVGGKDTRSDMTAETGTGTKPTFTPASKPDLAFLNCPVTATGALLTLTNNFTGKPLYSETFTVSAPQVTLITSAGNIVMELNPTAVPATVNNFPGYVSSGYYQSARGTG